MQVVMLEDRGGWRGRTDKKGQEEEEEKEEEEVQFGRKAGGRGR